MTRPTPGRMTQAQLGHLRKHCRGVPWAEQMLAEIDALIVERDEARVQLGNIEGSLASIADAINTWLREVGEDVMTTGRTRSGSDTRSSVGIGGTPSTADGSTRAGEEAGHPPPGSSDDSDFYPELDYDDFSQHWLCQCGDYIEDGCHCRSCGMEPPWGCPCDGCQGFDPGNDE